MAEPQVILYDIVLHPQSDKRQAASPNPWKTRLSLNHKYVPYKTIWVEHADIQNVGKAIGARTTDKRPDGEPRYTLPTIAISATGEVVSDSAKIAVYLEANYPEKPLFPEGKIEEHLAYEHELTKLLDMDFPLFITHRGYDAMSPASAAALERHVRETIGCPPFNDMPKPGPELLKRVERGFARLAAMYKGRNYLYGDMVTYSDILVATCLASLMVAMMDEETARFRTWDGGKWAKMVDELTAAGYYQQDHGELYKA